MPNYNVTLTFRKTNGDTWREDYVREADNLPATVQAVVADIPEHQRAWIVHVNAVDPAPVSRLQAVK